MSVVALAPDRVQQPNAARSKRPSFNYKRGTCPCCSEPMLVRAAQPDAPCLKCHEEGKPKLAIGTQPIPVER